jgi:hypothetical protein
VSDVVQLIVALGALLASCGGGYVYVDKRITKLQDDIAKCHLGHAATKGHLIVVGTVAGLMAERMRQIAPDDAVFKMARENLHRLYPVEHDTPSQLAALMVELRKLPSVMP